MKGCYYRMMFGSLKDMRESRSSSQLDSELIPRFNRGGKLPGLRGGPDARGCSGGSASDGEHCFSTRLMWRTSGAGEGKLTTTHSSQADDSLRVYPHDQGSM